MQRNIGLFIIIFTLAVMAFVADLMLGSVAIPLDSLWGMLMGEPISESWRYILLELRFPKAITACFVGAGMAVTGLQMQTLFQNPLADTSILGVGNGASLGVAGVVLLPHLFPNWIPNSLYHNYQVLIIASFLGAFAVLILVSSLATWMRDIISLLIVGVMLGFVTSALVSVLQYFSAPEVLQNFLVWTFGSLSGTSWTQLQYLIPIVSLGLLFSWMMPKNMNALLLGENYARSSGINVKRTRILLVALTGIITGTLTAFVGPIAFIGIAVPHIARLMFRTANHQILIPASILLGILIMLCCDIISQLPGSGTTLPINSVTSILGAPIVIAIILKNRQKKRIF